MKQHTFSMKWSYKCRGYINDVRLIQAISFKNGSIIIGLVSKSNIYLHCFSSTGKLAWKNEYPLHPDQVKGMIPGNTAQQLGILGDFPNCRYITPRKLSVNPLVFRLNSTSLLCNTNGYARVIDANCGKTTKTYTNPLPGNLITSIVDDTAISSGVQGIALVSLPNGRVIWSMPKPVFGQIDIPRVVSYTDEGKKLRKVFGKVIIAQNGSILSVDRPSGFIDNSKTVQFDRNVAILSKVPNVNYDSVYIAGGSHSDSSGSKLMAYTSELRPGSGLMDGPGGSPFPDVVVAGDTLVAASIIAGFPCVSYVTVNKEKPFWLNTNKKERPFVEYQKIKYPQMAPYNDDGVLIHTEHGIMLYSLNKPLELCIPVTSPQCFTTSDGNVIVLANTVLQCWEKTSLHYHLRLKDD